MKYSKGLDWRSVLVICLLIAFPLVYYTDLQIGQWEPELSNYGDDLGITEVVYTNEDTKEPLEFLLRSFVKGENHIEQPEALNFACHSDMNSEICVSSEATKIDTKTLTVYIPSNSTEYAMNMKPYARKHDEVAMGLVSQVEIRHGNITTAPDCEYFHNVPAIVFSSRGYAGNLFHEFNEIIIPLFVTTSHFKSHLQFVVSDFEPWLIIKYDRIFSKLSKYEIIDAAANQSVRCFPGAVVGLKYHNSLAVNISEIPGNYSMNDFKNFLRQAFSLKYIDLEMFVIEKPKLILISRRKTRVFLNEKEMVRMMEDLGFEVIALSRDLTDLEKTSQVLNSGSVMIGAHGAGLTNELFLPNGAVVVQMVPLGLEWASNAFYGLPAKDMDLKYIEYKIKPEESSLYDLYGPDDPVITDPESFFAKGFAAGRAVYLEGQNMTIHIGRLRETLVEAMRLIGLPKGS